MYPRLLELGPLTVYTYGVLLAAAYLFGLKLAMVRAKSRGLDQTRILDLGMIQPRLRVLYSWSAAELSIPELSTLVQDGVPTYAWDVTDAEPWGPAAGWMARAARRVLPSTGFRR